MFRSDSLINLFGAVQNQATLWKYRFSRVHSHAKCPQRFSRVFEAETGRRVGRLRLLVRRRGVNWNPWLSLTPAESGITIAKLSSPFFSPPAVLPSIESRSLGTRQESRKAEGTRSTDNNFGSARIGTTNEPASIRIIISCIIHDSLERPAEIIVSSTWISRARCREPG